MQAHFNLPPQKGAKGDPLDDFQITWQLESTDSEAPAVVRQAWRYLFDFWSEDRGEFHRDWYALASEIAKNGWSEIVLRRFADFGKPYIKVENSWGSPIPSIKEDYCLKDLIHPDVKYPDPPRNISIPDEWLARTVVMLRRNLETALELETIIGGYGLNNICSITPDDDAWGTSHSRSYGLSAWVLYFVNEFKRLISVTPKAAKAEFSKWSDDDTTIFARLKIWALGQSDLISEAEFRTVFDELPDEAFWGSYHARDLLLTLSARWNDLEVEMKSQIEQRVLRGPQRWKNEEDGHFRKRKAWSSINILNWLHQQGCILQLDLDATTEELHKETPDWKPEYAKKAARSLEGRGGSVSTNTEYSELLHEPLNTTLAKAKELSERQESMGFVVHDPFAGLSQNRPIRAFAVLREPLNILVS